MWAADMFLEQGMLTENTLLKIINNFLCLQVLKILLSDFCRDVESLVLSKMSRVPGLPSVLWQCHDCTFTSKNRHNVFDHVESKHVEHEGYLCQICNKTCPTLGAFRKHTSRNHGPSKQF